MNKFRAFIEVLKMPLEKIFRRLHSSIIQPQVPDRIPEQKVCRMLEQIEALSAIAALPQDEFYKVDARDEAAAIAASLGRNALSLPGAFRRGHPEISWKTLEDFRQTAFHDGICVLTFQRDLLDHLPALKAQLLKALAGLENGQKRGPLT